MDLCYYYQILDTGLLCEKLESKGGSWKFGERRRLNAQIKFWKEVLIFVKREKEGQDCTDEVFDLLKKIGKKYKLRHYISMYEKKSQVLTTVPNYEINKSDESEVRWFMWHLLEDLNQAVNIAKNKRSTYRLITAMHNLPKTMHGDNVLNSISSHYIISHKNALMYAKGWMDGELLKKYSKLFEKYGI